jgi:two-component system phosphate regulon response regulator PhoB
MVKKMNSVLIIEDEEALRDIIKFNLKKIGYTINDSANANDALIMMEEFLPDIILLDLMLPGLKGETFLSLIKKNNRFSHIPVIVISAKNKEEDIVKCLEAGADDYMTKPFSMQILIAKINTILRRYSSNSDQRNEYEGIVVDEENYRIFIDDKELELTHKEYMLLSFFIKHPKQVFTRNQLLSNIWGYESDVYTRTVDSHISSLRKKLEEKGPLIKSIPKIGYKFE